MAHGRTGPDLVMNIRYVGDAEIAHVSRHELHRTQDGTSAIDPARSALNRVLVGPRTQADAVARMIERGVRPPAAQSESPFVQIVLSASPDFFRDSRQGPGQWNEETMRLWTARSLRWLRREYGRDLAHVSLHLDEDTPHLHVLIVPTYEKKARKPGRQKRGETADEFEARKAAAAAAPVVRTMGRASSEKWGDGWSKLNARKSYHAAVEPLGLGYGHDFVGAGEPSPTPKATGAWVRQEAARLRAEAARTEEERGKAIRARWDARKVARAAQVTADALQADAISIHDAALSKAARQAAAFDALAVAASSIMSGEPVPAVARDALRSEAALVLPSLEMARGLAAGIRADREAAANDRARAAAAAVAADNARKDAERAATDARAAWQEAVRHKNAAARAEAEVVSLRERLNAIVDQAIAWLRDPAFPLPFRAVARSLAKKADRAQELPRASLAELALAPAEDPGQHPGFLDPGDGPSPFRR